MTAQRRAATAAAAIALPVLTLLLAACGGGASSRAGAWELLREPTPTDTVVPIRVEHAPYCEEYSGVDVEETADAVRITVPLRAADRGPGEACALAALVTEVDVPLEAPLGDREIGGPGYLGVSATG